MNDELEYEAGPESMTKAELKAEARARGLSTTGTREALLERVEQHDSAAARGDVGGRGGSPPDLAAVTSSAARAITELTGQAVDGVSGARRSDAGYHVTVEVREVPRVPPTTDVLATYEVDVDPDGTVTGYARVHRYHRNRTGRE